MSILSSILLLGGIGAAGAVALSLVAKKFRVDEDERIGQIEALLPGANCGSCGCKGCHDFAVACHQAGSLAGLNCPVAGAEGMGKIAQLMGVEASAVARRIAVVKCAGTPETKTRNGAKYSGPRVCTIMNMGVGDYACLASCLGCGDCVEACPFGAISLPAGASTPVVNPLKCTGCGQCALMCPRGVIELRVRGPKVARVWVACSNCLKGAVARKQCSTACIGCGLCARNCPYAAITVVNNLARIDGAKCQACGKCISACPTHAIRSNQPIEVLL